MITSDLHTIERQLRDMVSKEGYEKTFQYLDQLKNVWAFGTVTISFDKRSVLYKKKTIELIEHGFQGYEYTIQSLKKEQLPILSKWIDTQE